ncbi:HEAT repeat domain-containing protein [Gemmatimonas sp.]|uniref:HEAT repeat domain-containing protein n=1 Tax=Gemmatimonas sp. TaxID=1962908 RepID=UPI003983D3FE
MTSFIDKSPPDSSGASLPIEFVYAAALALLMAQLRARAPMSDVLASVARLRTLARVGRVVLDRRQLRRANVPELPEGVVELGGALERHGLDAVELATTMTDAEFLKLAGLLIGDERDDADALIESADALSIWNVRFLSAHTGEFVRVPSAPKAAPTRPLSQPVAFPVSIAASNVMPADLEAQVSRIELAVAQGDGMSLCRELADLSLPAHFAKAATPLVLQLVVEQLLDSKVSPEDVIALVQRAGSAGAHATFLQLIAAIDAGDRRTLYDAMVSLAATPDVAREYLAHNVWYVVRNAVCLLGESRSPAAIDPIGQALRHADYRVRIAAVVSLGQIGGPVALARLESVLFDSSVDVRTRALSIVFAAPDGEPLPDRLVGVLNEEQAIEYQLEIVAALGHLHTPRARQRLQQLCETPANSFEGTELRIAALESLRHGHPEVADAMLLKLQDDPSPMVRERIASMMR